MKIISEQDAPLAPDHPHKGSPVALMSMIVFGGNINIPTPTNDNAEVTKQNN